MSTFEINDGFKTILFHTLLPPPDEEEEGEIERRAKDGGGRDARQAKLFRFH